jgi:biopolymer transport protein ExbD
MARKKVDDPSAAANATFNMTPMIDVVFQLIVVFLCSLKFRCLDQKIEAFLPKDVGLSTAPASATVDTKLSLRLRKRPEDPSTAVILVDSRIGTTASDGIWNALVSRIKEYRDKDPKIKGEIDADSDVAHGDVIRALDCFMAANLTDVVFRGTQLNKSGSFQQAPPKR